ncbi:Hsp20/alpha crystallin family protein [Paenibacillus eucommiae]|uniref:HSP20 family molecular chaperone IbpA n=1 Tax=Paenibacillus eucommiae TaxID=1355755 RepID=A0ABS4J0T6_9BACL|nr:Hsp20/alpha crystallin family protein [Paenibacillus eucommiae]MBP1992384.1 HSP20 family molecular chaperone IbpA [Paenibacillus eucommiae]
MSESNRQPWLKWENIEKFLGQKLPVNAKEKGQSLLDNMSWVENYVQDVLKKSMPRLHGEGTLNEEPSIEVFETHEHVIAQIKLSKEEDPRALQVFVKSNLIKLTGFLKGGNKFIKLPVLVNPKTARASYKARTLQIQIRKRDQKESYHEAYIRF